VSGISTIALDELMAPNSGSVDPSRFPDEIFDLYSIPAFDNGRPELSLGREIGSSKQVVQPNDVLLSRIVPHIRRTWVVGEQRGYRQIASGEWIVFRSAKTHPNYLRYLLVEDHFHAQFMNTVAGVGGSLLRARPAQVADIEVPLRSLSEQKRIAGRLEQANRLVRTRRYALELTDTFLPAAFLEFFGDPVTNHMNWNMSPFQEVAPTRLGKMLDANQQTGKYDRPYLRNENVQWGRFDLREVSVMDFDADDREEFFLSPGDLLICEGGEPGRCAIWRGELPECYFQKALHRARPVLSKAIPEYLVHLLWSLARRGGLADYVTSATIAHLTGEKLKLMPIPVPPLPLQQKFAALVERVERLRAVQREGLRQAGHLFQTLLHAAFAERA
jgi:type I restriction enzyme, S subunit